jgi:hypothetical protein
MKSTGAAAAMFERKNLNDQGRPHIRTQHDRERGDQGNQPFGCE